MTLHPLCQILESLEDLILKFKIFIALLTLMGVQNTPFFIFRFYQSITHQPY